MLLVARQAVAWHPSQRRAAHGPRATHRVRRSCRACVVAHAPAGRPPPPSHPSPQASAPAPRRNCRSLRSPRRVRQLRNARQRQLLARSRIDPRAPSTPPQQRPWVPPPRPTHARPGAYRHRPRSPAHLQASPMILRSQFVGSRGAGLDARKPQRQGCDESRSQGGQAPNQASSGRQTGAAVQAGQFIAKARKHGQHPDETQPTRRHQPWPPAQTDRPA